MLIGFALTAGQFLATHHLYVAVAIPAFLFLAMSVASGLWCLKPRGYKDVPDPEPFVREYAALSYQRTLGGFIGSRYDAFRENETQRLAKLRWWRYSLWALIVGAVLSAASIWLGSR